MKLLWATALLFAIAISMGSATDPGESDVDCSDICLLFGGHSDEAYDECCWPKTPVNNVYAHETNEDIAVQTKPKYEEGTATVAHTDPNRGCPHSYLGMSRTARASGCGHSVCTAAKGQATNDLVNALTGTNGAGCTQFIDSTGRCKKGPGCLSLYYNLEAYEDITVQTKPKYEEGTATVAHTDPNRGCPHSYLGMSRTARASGCGHSVCTAAKGQATNDLVNALTGTNGAGCTQFIDSTGRCKKGPGCLSLYYNLEAYEDVTVQKKPKYEQGKAEVTYTNPSKGCPHKYIGTWRTARETGCGHNVCTAAKRLATNDLVNYLTGTNDGAGCTKYITSNDPCETGKGCKNFYF